MKASVVIPSYNACDRLDYNLLSLGMQNCPKDLFEVVVVDNCSTDNTSKVLAKHRDNIALKMIHLPKHENRSFARNVGVAAALGDIIIFSDSDMLSEKDFISKHIEAHVNANEIICGVNWEKVYTFFYRDFTGYLLRNLKQYKDKYDLTMPIEQLPDRYRLISEEKILNGQYKDYAFSYSIYEHAYQAVLNRHSSNLTGYNFPWSFFITNNCSVRKENLMKAGMFDEEFKGWGCEDLDLGYRLYKDGCTFKKLNIESLHQEHPVNAAESGLKNIYYFTEKYNSIDVLLYYFHSLIPVDASTANDIVNDVYDIADKKQYQLIIEIFAGLLKIVRDKAMTLIADKRQSAVLAKKVRQLLLDNKLLINRQCNELAAGQHCALLIPAFKSLAKRAVKVEI